MFDKKNSFSRWIWRCFYIFYMKLRLLYKNVLFSLSNLLIKLNQDNYLICYITLLMFNIAIQMLHACLLFIIFKEYNHCLMNRFCIWFVGNYDFNYSINLAHANVWSGLHRVRKKTSIRTSFKLIFSYNSNFILSVQTTTALNA